MHNLVGKKNTKTKFSKLKVKIYYQRVKTSSDPCDFAGGGDLREGELGFPFVNKPNLVCVGLIWPA